MLLRLGIASVIYPNRRALREAACCRMARAAPVPMKRRRNTNWSSAQTISNHFPHLIGFGDSDKQAHLQNLLNAYKRKPNRETFFATVESVCADGMEDVYDVQVPGINSFDANGLHAHNCGEQPLPPYGSCLLGSVNLTSSCAIRSTESPFDWDEYREVVRVFTRMLDNVVEINGLPLEQQRGEITRKRRHGMGFLGLGSTIAMLKMRYGSAESCEFTERIARAMALAGWETGLSLAGEKGPAPIMTEEFTVTAAMLRKRPEMQADGYKVGDKVPGSVLQAKLQPLHAAHRRGRRRTGRRAGRNRRALHSPLARSRRPARFRCRWPTTPAMASSLRSRITIRATSSEKARSPRKRSTCSVTSCSPTAH